MQPMTARPRPTPAPAEPAPSALGTALDRVGDRWSLLLVEALLPGSRRFNELGEAVPGIAPNILSDRLRRLERAGILVATPYTQRPLRMEYALSADGRELAGALHLLADWGVRRGGPGEPLRHELVRDAARGPLALPHLRAPGQRGRARRPDPAVASAGARRPPRDRVEGLRALGDGLGAEAPRVDAQRLVDERAPATILERAQRRCRGGDRPRRMVERGAGAARAARARPAGSRRRGCMPRVWAVSATDAPGRRTTAIGVARRRPAGRRRSRATSRPGPGSAGAR